MARKSTLNSSYRKFVKHSSVSYLENPGELPLDERLRHEHAAAAEFRKKKVYLEAKMLKATLALLEGRVQTKLAANVEMIEKVTVGADHIEIPVVMVPDVDVVASSPEKRIALADAWLIRLQSLIPPKNREVIAGDLTEDVKDYRDQGWEEWRIVMYLVRQFVRLFVPRPAKWSFFAWVAKTVHSLVK